MRLLKEKHLAKKGGREKTNQGTLVYGDFKYFIYERRLQWETRNKCKSSWL